MQKVLENIRNKAAKDVEETRQAFGVLKKRVDEELGRTLAIDRCVKGSFLDEGSAKSEDNKRMVRNFRAFEFEARHWLSYSYHVVKTSDDLQKVSIFGKAIHGDKENVQKVQPSYFADAKNDYLMKKNKSLLPLLAYYGAGDEAMNYVFSFTSRLFLPIDLHVDWIFPPPARPTAKTYRIFSEELKDRVGEIRVQTHKIACENKKETDRLLKMPLLSYELIHEKGKEIIDAQTLDFNLKVSGLQVEKLGMHCQAILRLFLETARLDLELLYKNLKQGIPLKSAKAPGVKRYTHEALCVDMKDVKPDAFQFSIESWPDAGSLKIVPSAKIELKDESGDFSVRLEPGNNELWLYENGEKSSELTRSCYKRD